MTRLRTIWLPLALGIAALVFASVNFASGAAPLTGSGTLHACIAADGSARLVAPTDTCADGEQAISWAETPPAGATGLRGLDGAPGLPGPSGPRGPVGEPSANYPKLFRYQPFSTTTPRPDGSQEPIFKAGNFDGFTILGAVAPCPVGWKAVGGGATTFSADYRRRLSRGRVSEEATSHIAIRESYPVALTTLQRKVLARANDHIDIQDNPEYGNTHSDWWHFGIMPPGLDGWFVEARWKTTGRHQPSAEIAPYVWCVRS